MPHFTLEYSANIANKIDVPSLFEKLHETAISTNVFPLGGIRSRGYCCEHFRVSDGNPDQAFVHLMVRIGHGRDKETKKAVADKIFTTLTEHLDHIFQSQYLAISFEMMESPPEPELSYKKNNIHARFK